MAMTWDLSDVPAVEAADLAAAMRALIANERALVLLRGANDADLDTVQDELKRRFQGDPQRALACFLRFRHLIEVFTARRLSNMLLETGHALLAPAIAVAASLRLNANRGFNPQSFVMSLSSALTANVVALELRPAAAVEDAIQPLAA